MPRSMRRYLDYYGWHFNQPAFEFAASLMWKEDENGKKKKVEPVKKDDIDKILKDNKVEIENKGNWDYMYWAQQAKADLMPEAIEDDKHYGGEKPVLNKKAHTKQAQHCSRFSGKKRCACSDDTR